MDIFCYPSLADQGRDLRHRHRRSHGRRCRPGRIRPHLLP
jgi:hypothetical protein